MPCGIPRQPWFPSASLDMPPSPDRKRHMNSAEPKEMSTHLRARLHDQHLQLQAAGPGPWPEDLVTATLKDTVALLNLQLRTSRHVVLPFEHGRHERVLI